MPKIYGPLTKGSIFSFFIDAIRYVGLGTTEEHVPASGDGFVFWDVDAGEFAWVDYDNMPGGSSNASDIPILDTAGNFDAEDVEGALAEGADLVKSKVTGQTINNHIVGKAYYNSSESVWDLAEKTIEATISGTIGICSDPTTIRYFGDLTLTGHGYAINSSLYIDDSGFIVDSPPSEVGDFIRCIGAVKDENTIRISISDDYSEVG